MVSVEQLAKVIQAGGQRFVFGHEQKSTMIEYLKPEEMPTTFCRVKEYSIASSTLRKNGLFVLLTSQRLIVIALNPRAGSKGWDALDFDSIDLSEIVSCFPVSKGSVTLVLTEGNRGSIVGWKKSMQQMHDALVAAIGQDANAAESPVADVTRGTSARSSDSQSVPSASASAGHSISGRFRIALHFCFMTVPGLIAVTLTVVAAVFLPGPAKMVPVLILAGVIAQRVSSGASG